MNARGAAAHIRRVGIKTLCVGSASPEEAEALWQTILAALELKAAAEDNDGTGCELIENLRTEADLCRNETATDIADLLDDAASALIATGAQFNALKDERNGLAARVVELEQFHLERQSAEYLDAERYRYLRDRADENSDGPIICSGLGDNFDFLRGPECDEEIDAARSKP